MASRVAPSRSTTRPEAAAAPDLRPGSLRLRGGLGRTLLTAFLFLAIGPLSVVGLFALIRARAESLTQHRELLVVAADGYAARFEGWRQYQRADLAQTARTAPAPRWPDIPESDRWLLSNIADLPPALAPVAEPLLAGRAYLAPDGQLWHLLPDAQGLLLARHALPDLNGWGGNAVVPLPFMAADSRVAVVTGAGHWCLDGHADQCDARLSAETIAALTQAAPGHQPAIPSDPERLIAARPLGGVVGAVIVVSQPRAAAVRASENLAAALIAAILLAALGTAVAAAIITRQITRPVFELTRTVVLIARGDLARRAPVSRHDELGVLSIAFNAMADQLQNLLATLEQRVADRTAELQAANAQIERRARQLVLSAEIGRELAMTTEVSIVLSKATALICHRFGYLASTVWLWQEQADGERRLEATTTCAPGNGVGPHEIERTLARQVVADGIPRGTTHDGPCVPLTTGARLPILGLPLRIGEQTIGALVLSDETGFDAGDGQALQTLADQVTIAIESAHAADIERSVADKLRELERHRAAYLGELSHEFGTSLNSIIGFSRLMLKEVEGPLTEMQRSDLTFINRNGQHLLSLLDGILDLVETDREELPETDGESPPA